MRTALYLDLCKVNFFDVMRQQSIVMLFPHSFSQHKKAELGFRLGMSTSKHFNDTTFELSFSQE